MKIQKKYLCLFFALVLSMAMAVQANAFELGARAYVWFPTVTGDVRSNYNGVEGSTISLTDTLGISNKPTYSLEAYGGVGNHHVSFAYTPFSYSDSKVLSSTITFNGSTYTGGTSVQTDLNFSMFDLRYQYDLVNLENILAGFSLGPIIQLKYVTGDMKLTAAGIGNNQSRSASLPIPMVGLGAHVGLIAKWLEFRAQATGMGYSGNFILEGSADLSLSPIPFVDIHGGYKIMKLKIDTNDFYMDSQFAGPYGAITIGF